MDTASLHSPLVRQLIEALNNGRLDDFMALFAPDATVVDEQAYHGYETIRAWAQRENFAVHMHLEVVREKNKEGTELELQAASTGVYSGPATFTVTMRDGLIERLVIG